MNKNELTAWFVRTVIVIALTVAVSLINRHLGVKIDVPPPPPVTVVVEPQPGGTEPKIAVTRQP